VVFSLLAAKEPKKKKNKKTKKQKTKKRTNEPKSKENTAIATKVIWREQKV